MPKPTSDEMKRAHGILEQLERETGPLGDFAKAKDIVGHGLAVYGAEVVEDYHQLRADLEEATARADAAVFTFNAWKPVLAAGRTLVCARTPEALAMAVEQVRDAVCDVVAEQLLREYNSRKEPTDG